MIVLSVDDSPEHHELVRLATEDCELDIDLHCLNNAEQLLHYLYGRGIYSNLPNRPDVVLLDLNMPGKHGLEVLAEIKADPATSTLPVVVFTTSEEEADVFRSYDIGASLYLRKPDGYYGYVNAMKAFHQWWQAVGHSTRSGSTDAPGRLRLGPAFFRKLAMAITRDRHG